ncbi:MAG: hypothetical protein NVSMB64_29920 [Candidatus Velthaea sp.]
MSLLLVLFIVGMFIWLIFALGEWPAPYNRVGGIIPWVCVLLLYMLVRGVHIS